MLPGFEEIGAVPVFRRVEGLGGVHSRRDPKVVAQPARFVLQPSPSGPCLLFAVVELFLEKVGAADVKVQL